MKNIDRRSFIKSSAVSGGGLLLSFSWITDLMAKDKTKVLALSEQWHELASYIKITPDNVIKILCPNPEFGQNVMTSLPMIAAEELDCDYKKVIVEVAPHDAQKYGFQFTGGSQSVRSYWKPMRNAGAAAKQMLKEAAASTWGLPVSEISTQAGVLKHISGKTATYGQMATKAASLPVPKDLKLKNLKNFTLLGKSQKNKEGQKIVSGKALFSSDYKYPGMLISMPILPPAFGLTLKSFDAKEALKMPGIEHIFSFKVYEEGTERGAFETRTFNEIIAVVGKSTYEVMNARKKVKAVWNVRGDKKEMTSFRNNKVEEFSPGALESTDKHYAAMLEMSSKEAQVLRKDGEPETAFKNAATIIERTYNAPFLAHNCMEPMVCFAHVEADKALIIGPLQAPGFVDDTLSNRLGIPKDKIEIQMSRMGGGFGRRAYPHYMVEASMVSKMAKAPIKYMYAREDDMAYGIYRPMYTATYRAALDANKKLIAFHVKGGGIPEHPVHANRFPAGAVEHYMAEGWTIPSNITIGAFRAPRSNFNAAAEQSFLDEVAAAMGKDPIDLRLELLQKAQDAPVGKNNDYDAKRYAGVLKLLKEKSGWNKSENSKYSRGVAAYFCHNSYAGHVVDIVSKDGQPYVERVTSVMDCGVVINPDSAINMVQGAVIDGIGNAFYGNMSFKEGSTDHKNFDSYRMIRHHEAPKSIDVHFVESESDPTGLGEPPFPPVFGAIANALFKNTGKRFYNQPFSTEQPDTKSL
jgi:isoquinoline 1-oxidoreductase subunit beta